MIITRTIVLVALSLEFAAVPFAKFSVSFKRIGTVVLVAGWISVIPAGIFLINDYRQTRLAEEPVAPVIDLIHNSGVGYPIVFADNRTFRRLYSSVHSLAETLSLPPAKHVPEDVRVKWLADLAARGPFWLITDVSDPETTESNRQADQLGVRSCLQSRYAMGRRRITIPLSGCGGSACADRGAGDFR